MKKIKLFSAFFLAVILTGCTSKEGQESYFEPYHQSDVRLPSVPLILSDPYLSIWSPTDKLNESVPQHWTDQKKPLNGLLRVDGQTYQFLGSAPEHVFEPLAPATADETWKAPVCYTVQKGLEWTQPDFDDSSWQVQEAAWGSEGNNIKSRWGGDNKDLYIRRTVELTEEQLKNKLFILYSHDDCFELYVNGTEVINTGNTWLYDQECELKDELHNLLKPGKNLISAHCHNTVGGAYADFGLYADVKGESAPVTMAEQKSIDVMATSSYYTFACGPVELDVVFTAPMIIDDYDLLSAPINYVSYQVRSTDGKEHEVQLYLGASSLLSTDNPGQPTISTLMEKNGKRYVRTGTIDQPVLARKGDGVCIDWGYLYLPEVNGTVSMGTPDQMQVSFAKSGQLPACPDTIICRKPSEQPELSIVHDFGTVASASSYAMLGYDEDEDIEYMYHRYKGYWAHEGQVDIFSKFDELNGKYDAIMGRCREMDKRIYDDAFEAGGQEYADLLAGAYRHVIAAHKLFRDKDGNLLFFSKENNSNGCVNTVDLTYPSCPLFLTYNPELQKAMMTSIMEYSRSGRWTKPFSAHDLGTYPIANAQVYGADMPIEEAGNMLILAAAISMEENDISFANKYWDIFTTWSNYLLENGLDPADQLCTDDFAGHLAHNCNLSIKAILGIAGYGIMAGMRGDEATKDSCLQKAREMAAIWEKDAFDGDHYRLTFDAEGSWSQKYNIIWDKIWGLGLFSDKVYSTELAYYQKIQNKYGVPLDSRATFTKSDWVMWTASLAPDEVTFKNLMMPIYHYVNEGPRRVPIGDLHDTNTGVWIGMKARSVIGGYWMRVYEEKNKK